MNDSEHPERMTGRESSRGEMHRKGSTEHVTFIFAAASVALMLVLYVGLIFYFLVGVMTDPESMVAALVEQQQGIAS